MQRDYVGPKLRVSHAIRAKVVLVLLPPLLLCAAVGVAQQPASGGPPPPTNVNPAPATTPSPSAGNTTATQGSDDRLQQARSADIGAGSWVAPQKQSATGCPITSPKPHNVDVYYESGSSSDSRLSKTGLYCFAVNDANALFDWAVSLNVTEPSGNPFDLINDAIQTLSKLATGATKQPTPAPGCTMDLDSATKKSTALTGAFSNLTPKDSNGKVVYAKPTATQAAMNALTAAFGEYETAVRSLQTALKSPDATKCDSGSLSQAEDILLKDYPKVRKDYQDLATRLSHSDVQYYERRLDPTSSADLVVTPSYSGTAMASKTYHFDPSFGILSSSAGFVLTELQARSYSSATAPDPNDPTKTQNVLKVDYGSGIRPALVVLLTGNLPQLNRRNLGIGVSAGPLFDVSSGKADTSKFGFFGGLSLRVTPWVFLTPGVHVGEFADFPQGFTHAGQVIPANTGTPSANKRYSARFAFAITWRIKDLGASTGQAGQQPSSSGQTNAKSGTGSQ